LRFAPSAGPSGLRGRLPLLGDLYTRTPRLGQPYRDRLLGGPRAVLPLADVVYLLANELAGLRRRSLPFACVLTRSLDRFVLRHLVLLD
jgi:hypothetical protein